MKTKQIMQRLMRSGVQLIIAVLVISGLTHTVFSQGEIRKGTIKITDGKKGKKTSPHKFAMVDPYTGKPVNPHDWMHIAEEKNDSCTYDIYYGDISIIEKNLAETGKHLKTVADNNKVGKDHDTKALEAQAKKLKQGHKTATLSGLSVEDVVKRKVSEMKQFQEQNINSPFVETAAFGEVTGKEDPEVFILGDSPRKAEKSYETTLGEGGKFKATLKAKMSADGTKEGTTLLANAEAIGVVYDHPITLIKAQAEVKSLITGENSVDMTVDVKGLDSWNYYRKEWVGWNVSDGMSKSFDWPVTFNFTIGPVPCTVTLGARGSAGFNYYVAVSPAAATASLTPYVSAEAYIEGGVNLWAAAAGVGGSMTLLNDTMYLNGNAYIAYKENFTPYLRFELNGYNEVNALSGNIYIWAKTWAPWPFKGKRWEWNLWKFNGFSASGELFNLAQDVSF
jgi:hypothetical protein